VHVTPLFLAFVLQQSDIVGLNGHLELRYVCCCLLIEVLADVVSYVEVFCGTLNWIIVVPVKRVFWFLESKIGVLNGKDKMRSSEG
jgi:hypothetical protein